MKFFASIGQYIMLLWRVFSLPQKWKIFRRQVVNEMYSLGIMSTPIVAIVSFFVGAVIAIQTALNLAGLPAYVVGFATRESLILEFCSTMIALILAGKVGSSIASQIGSMRISEQIDALELMGVNAASYLILPKIIGLVLLVPFITIFSITLGIFGGYVGILVTDFIGGNNFIEGIQMNFMPYYVAYSIIKSMVFAFIITSVSAYWGYNVKRGSLEVGKNSTRAVVMSSISILVFNLVLTELLL
ncbi:MAG: ABC transporter permease [Prevotellaceae bacterium]|jgi:phospholipid/cholesterol/gamma-HCH transport system permease protein|nr:ABC transporter permease [Prevotellaceae bacterium]